MANSPLRTFTLISRCLTTAWLLATAVLFLGCASEPPLPERQIQGLSTTVPAAPSPPAALPTSPRTTVARATYVEPAPIGPLLTPTPPPNIEPAIRPYDEWTDQEIAADALGRIGPTAVPALRQALQSEDPEARAQAVRVLARMGSGAKEAVPDLVRLLDDPNEEVRRETTRTLGRIGPAAADAVPALMKTLLTPEP